MSKREEYLSALKPLKDWDEYLLQHSGLPGPRGNLELAHATVEIVSRDQVEGWLKHSANSAPTNDPHEFLAFCGVLGLGRLIGEGKHEYVPRLREAASDERWRIREAVSQAATLWAKKDADSVIGEMLIWSRGNLLECRAAVASIADLAAAKLLGDDPRALEVMNHATSALVQADEKDKEARLVLLKGLSYCWSVVIVAQPERGKRGFEAWLESENPLVRKMIAENLKKKRLLKVDEAWVKRCAGHLKAM